MATKALPKMIASIDKQKLILSCWGAIGGMTR